MVLILMLFVGFFERNSISHLFLHLDDPPSVSLKKRNFMGKNGELWDSCYCHASSILSRLA